jgi:predicted nucleic acid-binding protein
LLDANVIVAAIKNPRRETGTLRLLTKIIKDPTVGLVADELLLEEMIRYAELLKSPTTTAIIAALAGKTSLVKVYDNYRSICKAYVRTPDKADILHAAACLQTGAVLITNDRHFTQIGKKGIIEVWSITRAITNML